MTNQLLTAQMLGITTSLFLSGSAFTYTFAAAPACLLAPPALAASQWKHLYLRGRSMSPPLAVLSSSAWAYCAYTTGESVYYWVIGLVVGIVPYTLAVMMPTNQAIGGMAGKKDADGALLQKLVKKWEWLNAVRFITPALGGAIGLWTALSK
ncbi:hypothetical protein EDC01DRAFT_360263 [Geopyxis carbonaria]|nr:hypothetical protein EDC01DRAFT_360263 [Geopyxis carbonaria]